MAEQATARLENLDGIGAHASLPNQGDLPVVAVGEEEAFTVPAADDLLEMFETEDDEAAAAEAAEVEDGDDAADAAGTAAESTPEAESTEPTETPAAP